MKKIYYSFRTTRAALSAADGDFMLAVNTLQAPPLILNQADLDYATDETVFITGTGFQPNEIVSLNKLLN